MKLLNEIIDLASSDKGSVPTLLRKCLVLAHTLKNDRLKAWAENELNGYRGSAELPEYRKTVAPAKGLFVGPFRAQVNDQPIPSAMLEPKHRHWAESVQLSQPIAAYENVDPKSNYKFDWPANLIVLYQAAFFEGTYALNRAWQEIPGSVIAGLLDTIKTRVLRFALELQEEIGAVGENISELRKERVDQQVVNYIFGGTNVIASSEFTQTNQIQIKEGDWNALAIALKGLGVETSAVSDLKSALDCDRAEDVATPGMGTRVRD
jgi:hypothetical protein